MKEVMAGLDGSVDINSTVNTVGSGFKSPYGIAVDVNGNVFVSDFFRWHERDRGGYGRRNDQIDQ